MRFGIAARWWVGGGLVWWSGLAAAQAQVTPPPARTYSVKLDVVPLVTGGYHVSVEKVWGPAHRQALVVTPQLYRGAIQDVTSDLSEGPDRVRGYGLAVQHRLYLNGQTTPSEGFYVAYGPHYQHFELQFQAAGWEPETTSNGLIYYEYRTRNQKETVDRYGGVAVFGGQTFVPDTPVFIDAYVGLGLRKANSRSTLPGNHYASGMSDYGAEGVYVPIGFRIGVAW